MRGSLSRRALPMCSAAPGSLNSASHHPVPVGAAQRLFASASKATPAAPTSASQPKGKGPEKIEQAEMFHTELKKMIATEKARPKVEEVQASFGSGFIAFLKASKPELVNIFFAFVCVLLAYQIHGMRAGIRKLLAAQEEKDAEIDRLRGILVNLSKGDAGSSEAEANEDAFSMKLARKCAGIVRNIFEESEKRVGYSWILGKKLASGDAMELEKLVDEMHPVVLTDIQSAVGDAAFTPEELKERRVASLKEPTQSKMSTENDAQIGDLMEILKEVHDQDLTDEPNVKSAEDSTNTSTKVRRTRYAI